MAIMLHRPSDRLLAHCPATISHNHGVVAATGTKVMSRPLYFSLTDSTTVGTFSMPPATVNCQVTWTGLLTVALLGFRPGPIRAEEAQKWTC